HRDRHIPPWCAHGCRDGVGGLTRRPLRAGAPRAPGMGGADPCAAARRAALSRDLHGAQDHYTERLVRLPRLGCCFSATELEASPVDLRTLGIEPDRPLLLSPGTPYKYAPQYDWVFPAIAKRLSRCTIAFFKDASAPWSPLHDKLLDRLSAAFAAHGLRFSDHCVVLPWLDKPTYYGLMQKADIMLDTIGFSGFNTAMQAVECGLPIVTREGRFMRGRLA